MRVSGVISTIPLLFCMLFPSHANAKESGTVLKVRTILLVDDYDVLYRPGTKRVLHSPKRHEANPVIAETKSWELVIGYCSVYRDADTGRYQCWYQSYAGGRATRRTHRLVVCYAESDDGINWVKPDLGVHEFNDIKNTNIVLIQHVPPLETLYITREAYVTAYTTGPYEGMLGELHLNQIKGVLR